MKPRVVQFCAALQLNKNKSVYVFRCTPKDEGHFLILFLNCFASLFVPFQTEVDDIPGALAPFQVGSCFK